jgi:fatty acid desaturase
MPGTMTHADTGRETSSSDYRALAERVRAAGLLERRPGRYGARLAFTGAALAAGWTAVFLVGNSWAVLAVAAFLAVVFIQVVFVGHDAGHQQIFRSHRANRLVGLTAGNVLTGLSFGWWVRKHNAHHAHPNQVDRDPDIGPGVIAFTPEIACRRRGVGRFLARWQAWLFFPLLTFEGMALHVASIRVLARKRNRQAAIEGVLLAAHAVFYLGVVFWLLSPIRAVAFIAIQQALFGLYLGCTFAPNHKGMEMLGHDANESFLRRQVITSRNVTGGAITTLLLGGLNYQIEHHLFPMMPRSNLARSQGIVRDFCRANDMPYQSCSLLDSYRQVLTHLGAVGSG